MENIEKVKNELFKEVKRREQDLIFLEKRLKEYDGTKELMIYEEDVLAIGVILDVLNGDIID